MPEAPRVAVAAVVAAGLGVLVVVRRRHGVGAALRGADPTGPGLDDGREA